MCKHGNVFSLPVLMDESLTTYIQRLTSGEPPGVKMPNTQPDKHVESTGSTCFFR